MVEIVKSLIELISALFWPGVLFFAIYYFRNDISKLIANISIVKYPGGEVKIQREDPEATKPKKETATQAKFVDPRGFYTRVGLTHLIAKSGLVAKDENVVGELKLFQSTKQHTWLIATNRQLFCVLDDEDTRSSGKLIQWEMPLDQASPIRARTSMARDHEVVDIGKKRAWLYSLHLYEDEEALVNDINKLIAKGMAEST